MSEVRWSAVFATLRLGLPTGIERVLDMAAFAAVPLLLASVGPTHLAAHQIALQLCTFSFLPLLALSDGGSVLVSQAVGAGHARLIHGVARSALGLASIYAASLAALFYLWRGPLVAIFSGDEAVRGAAEATLAMAALLQLVNAIYNALKGILRGLSQFRFVARVTVGVAWIITPPLTWLTSVHLGYGAPGAWFVMCVEVTLGAILLAQRWISLGSSLDRLAQNSDIQLVMR